MAPLNFRGILTVVGVTAALSLGLVGCSGISLPSASGGTGAAVAPNGQTAQQWADASFSTFAPAVQTGSGDSVIALPAGATHAIVTASYTGSGNFVIQSLGADNGYADLQPAVNVIGAYSGTSVVGFATITDAPTQLQVSSAGDWSITIAPVSSAPVGIPASGTGDTVFLYDGPAATLTAGFSGTGNFIVTPYAASGLNFPAINTIGNYSGSVPLTAGPLVISVEAQGISAPGSWTFSAS